MRLFVALPLPPALEEEARALLARLGQAGVTGTFTRRENLHLTLAFLGETQRIAPVAEAMEEAQTSPVELKLAKTGMFRRPGGNILWAGLEPCPALELLQSSLAAGLRQRGFVLEERPFRPHLTLVRRAQLPWASLPPELEPRPVVGTAGSMVLFESVRREGRLLYLPRHTRRLPPTP